MEAEIERRGREGPHGHDQEKREDLRAIALAAWIVVGSEDHEEAEIRRTRAWIGERIGAMSRVRSEPIARKHVREEARIVRKRRGTHNQ